MHGGKKRVTRKIKLRSELFIISKKGDMAYVDIPRKVKSYLRNWWTLKKAAAKSDAPKKEKNSPSKTAENFLAKVENRDQKAEDFQTIHRD